MGKQRVPTYFKMYAPQAIGKSLWMYIRWMYVPRILFCFGNYCAHYGKRLDAYAKYRSGKRGRRRSIRTVGAYRLPYLVLKFINKGINAFFITWPAYIGQRLYIQKVRLLFQFGNLFNKGVDNFQFVDIYPLYPVRSRYAGNMLKMRINSSRRSHRQGCLNALRNTALRGIYRILYSGKCMI
jgi:hypothetical protein